MSGPGCRACLSVPHGSSIFAGLDLLDTPSLYLPSPPDESSDDSSEAAAAAGVGGGGTLTGTGTLPVFKIALLEAGGRPLLSPPNVPHMVITVDTCVMVEQRRVRAVPVLCMCCACAVIVLCLCCDCAVPVRHGRAATGACDTWVVPSPRLYPLRGHACMQTACPQHGRLPSLVSGRRTPAQRGRLTSG